MPYLRSIVIGVLVVCAQFAFAQQQVVIVSSDFNDSVQMYDLNGNSLGALVPTGFGGLDSPQGLSVGPDGNVYVSSAQTNQVLRYSPAGTFLGQFNQGGGLGLPWFNRWGPDGKFYVSSAGTSQVLCYNANGSFSHVAASGHGLFRPDGFSFDNAGNILVSDFFAANSRIQKFNPTTGAWIADLVVDPGLNSPLENRLSPDGQTLFVSSYGTNEVRKYDANTGTFLGLAASSPLNGPVGHVVLPGGTEMLVTGWQANTIYRFSATSNSFLGTFTTGAPLSRPNNLTLLTIPEPAGAISIALLSSFALCVRTRSPLYSASRNARG